MSKVYAMIADGTEEVECLAVVDILRRAGVTVEIVSVNGKTITSSHGVVITADAVIGDVDLNDCDLLFVPGGMPGTPTLAADKRLIGAIDKLLKNNKRVAAVCAAPALVLGDHKFLNGKKAVCFPGYEEHLFGAEVQEGARVVTDGNITTARGLGTSIELGLELVRLLVGEKQSDDIKKKIQF